MRLEDFFSKALFKISALKYKCMNEAIKNDTLGEKSCVTFFYKLDFHDSSNVRWPNSKNKTRGLHSKRISTLI